jgi:hypothetical protein
MAASSNDPTTGSPIFLDSDAPDPAVNPTQVAEYAASVGTRLIGSTAERTAYTYAREGLRWYDTTLDREYIHTGSGWVVAFIPSEDTSVTFVGIYSSSGASPVRVHVENGRAFMEGIATSTSAGFSTGTNYDLGSIPEAYAPAENQLFLVSAGDNNSGRLVVQSSGAMIFSVLSAFTGVLSMGLGSVNWRIG